MLRTGRATYCTTLLHHPRQARTIPPSKPPNPTPPQPDALPHQLLGGSGLSWPACLPAAGTPGPAWNNTIDNPPMFNWGEEDLPPPPPLAKPTDLETLGEVKVNMPVRVVTLSINQSIHPHQSIHQHTSKYHCAYLNPRIPPSGSHPVEAGHGFGRRGGRGRGGRDGRGRALGAATASVVGTIAGGDR